MGQPKSALGVNPLYDFCNTHLRPLEIGSAARRSESICSTVPGAQQCGSKQVSVDLGMGLECRIQVHQLTEYFALPSRGVWIEGSVPIGWLGGSEALVVVRAVAGSKKDVDQSSPGVHAQ